MYGITGNDQGTPFRVVSLLQLYVLGVHPNLAWRDFDMANHLKSLWLFPAGHPPQYVPDYKPETGSTFIEDCQMMMHRHRPTQRHPSRGAATMRLQSGADKLFW
jgi:hypothetical protein